MLRFYEDNAGDVLRAPEGHPQPRRYQRRHKLFIGFGFSGVSSFFSFIICWGGGGLGLGLGLYTSREFRVPVKSIKLVCFRCDSLFLQYSQWCHDF